MVNFQEKVNFLWTIAEILRGPYKPEDYGKVILPMAVLRRFDCVLEDTKDAVLEQYEQYKTLPDEARDEILNRTSNQKFNNVSNYDFNKLLNDADNVAENFRDYINGFSGVARDIINYFDFDKQIEKMDRNDLLYLTIKRFSEIDLHPGVVSNLEMGYIFEELIRRYSEHAEAGDHFTPREVVRLMVGLMFNEDHDILTKPGITQTLYDSCAGTGGMGSIAQEYLKDLNPSAELAFFAQEFNEESYAMCKADTMIKGEEAKNIRFGNTLSKDAFPNNKFDYLITNPPYGVEWKPAEKAVKAEHEDQGFQGRFGAGLPRIGDGQLLFLQHLVSKMKPVTEDNPKGSRVAIIMNGSPLFTGDAGSGESEIRRYVIENDLVEAIVAMPTSLFYNTGISTYIWILTNHKAKWRQGKIQLINAVDFYQKMRKSLGEKRHEISQDQINEIIKMYGDYQEGEHVKIFDNEDFGFQKITVERPLKLNFKVDDERIERLHEQKAFQNLATSKKKGEAGEKEVEAGQKKQQAILGALQTLQDGTLYKNRDAFTKALKNALKQAGVDAKAPMLKAILAALGERDETADVCLKNSKGELEADPELRDTENVPLKEDIHEYVEREVLPHVPDAWIDEDKTKIGYEIPFTRHFYKYEQLRPSDEIKAEIQELEASILEKLKKVMV
ncbi:type I restriction-modification system subunit M [Salisediminibacterium beveridgei]|uniref:site-specific DNA-methyltransferase (adenine-specific) n=1 Tax=Salisediminibacterium beveridgei TaxID=632773 RepID=A0A1D7QZP3_9BACI|nr:class I SAM-dependent DNA methyltransferase [Salisediminibacterium beveridgei]AOM84472.1 Type I restriction-modification system, DNA-methyltransferase subunit M [Salisediminibacterium beveridgei]